VAVPAQGPEPNGSKTGLAVVGKGIMMGKHLAVVAGLAKREVALATATGVALEDAVQVVGVAAVVLVRVVAVLVAALGGLHPATAGEVEASVAQAAKVGEMAAGADGVEMLGP